MFMVDKVPSKAVLKTPFELWTNRTPNKTHACLGLLGKNKDL